MREELINIALKELGYKEGKNNNSAKREGKVSTSFHN